MSEQYDSICRAYFVTALDLARKEALKCAHSDDKKCRAALFVLANSCWGYFYSSLSADNSSRDSGNDEYFRPELKKLGVKMIKALESVSSWNELYEAVLGVVHTWLSGLEDLGDSVAVSDLELREGAIHFSEILFNACFAAGNPLRDPSEVSVALEYLRQEYAKWLEQLGT